MIKSIKAFSEVIILLSLSYSASGFTVSQKGDTLKLAFEIDSILQGKVNNDKIPGAVILIKQRNNILYKHAYGYAQKYDFNHNLLNPPEDMTADYLFDIASLTKVIGTTTSIMLLADRGFIRIEDPVHRYIKAFDTPEKRMITIRHLLTHTAGLYEWYPLYYHASGRQECYKLIGDLPLRFPVGARRHYSDLGYILLGEIIEIVSGLPLEDFMKLNIFIPLNMGNTTYNPLVNGYYNKIASTSAGNPFEKRMVYVSSLGFKIPDIDPSGWNGWRNYVLRGEVSDGNAWYANGGISGAAGLFSTIDDLQKLVDMLMNNGKIGSDQFISEKTIETFLSKDQFKNGLGWMMDPANSFMRNAPEGTFGHTGFTGTSITVIPKYKMSVILLMNRQNIGLLSTGAYYNVNPIRLLVFKTILKYLQ
jgi:serine-type D-Ala-D-Ala carboxypeptidase